jgi:site-specific DNA recombinase
MAEISSVRKVVLYARVSSEEQREGQTIDSQVAELKRFAADRTWNIVKIYKDDGWSGSLLARPALDELRDDAGSGESASGAFDGVLINDVDRLARDVAHLGIIKRDLERRGIAVIFRKLPHENSPTHNLMINILGSFAEFERELIIDRTRRGRRHKVESRGQYLGSNTAYGYRYLPKSSVAGTEGKLEIVPREAAVVRKMFAWVDREGLSARAVLRRLNEHGVRPRKGLTWGKSSVLRVLRGEIYAGVWHYNKQESCQPRRPLTERKYRALKTGRRIRPRSEWIPLELPPALVIIERPQWERVQQLITKNIAFSPRNSRHSYLLSGLVKCGGCGARYVGDPCHGKFYYRCYKRCKKCPSIAEHLLDEPVWQAVEDAMSRPEVIAGPINRQLKREADRRSAGEGEIPALHAELQQLVTEEGRILEAYRVGAVTPVILGRELEDLRKRNESVRIRLAEAEARRAVSPELVERSITEYCAEAAANLKTFTPVERQRFLRRLVTSITFRGDSATISGHIPLPDNGQAVCSSPEYMPSHGDGRIETTTVDLHGRNPSAWLRFETEVSLFHEHRDLPVGRGREHEIRKAQT